MAKDNVIGLAMGLDVTDLKAGINEVKKLVKQSKDEFNVATAGLDKWTKSADGLTAKLNQLDKQLDAQNKAVAGYKAEIDRVSKLEGDHSVQLEQLKSKLQKAEIEVKKTESSIAKYSNSLSEVNAENKKAESSFGKLTDEIEKQKAELNELEYEYKDAVLTYGKNSKEAKALEKQITSLNGELQDNQSEVKKADKQLEILEGQFDDTEEEAKDFNSALDNIKGLGATVAGGIGAIGATIGGLATAFFATAESTRELRTNMGKVETAFETAGLSAEDATETYKNLYAVVADEGKATEATSHIAKLAKSQEDLQKWTNICTGVYATFGDSLPIENLAEASNETAKTGKITGGLADALNWAGKSEEEFQASLDKCSNEQERNKLITETLNGLYSEASEKYQQTNKDVIESNKAQAELSDTMADLGAKAEPLLTTIKDGFNQVLQAVIELINGADFESIKAGIESAFQYFIDTIIPAIVDGFNWIMDNKDTLIAGIVAIGTGMLAWNVVSIVQGVVGAIKAWTAATEGMTLAQKALNLIMKANPIGLVVSLVVGLVAAFITLWNTSDEFRAFWINLWKKIQETTSKVIKAIGEFFSKLWSDIQKVWGKTIDWFKNIGSKIADGFKSATSKVKDFFSNTWKNIKNTWNGVIDWFKNIGTKIADGFKNATNKVKEFFSNSWNNIKKVWNTVSSWFSKIASKVINAFKNIPSKIKTHFANAWNNVKNIWSKVSEWFAKIKDKIVNAFKNIPSKIKSFFSNAWSNVKSAWSNPTKFFSDVKDKIINSFKNLPSKMLSVGKNLVEGLWNGIKDMSSWIVGKIKGFTGDVLGGIKKFFGIHSPSKETAEIGDYLVQGLAQGIEKNTKKAVDATDEMGEELLDSLKSVEKQIENRNIADKIIQLGGTVENPFDTWSLAAINNETKSLTGNLDEINSRLIANGVSQSQWGTSIEKMSERAKIIEERYNAQTRLLDLCNAKMKKYGDNVPEDLIESIDEIKEGLELTIEEAEELNEVFTKDSKKSSSKFVKFFDDAFTKIDERMAAWNAGVGGTLDNIINHLQPMIDKTTSFISSIGNIISQTAQNQIDALDAELVAYNTTKDAELQKLTDTYDAELLKLDERLAQGLISEEDYETQKEALDKKYDESTKAIEKEKEERELKALQEKDRIAREQFEAQKGTSIAQALIQGALAIVTGFAQLGPIGGAINAAVQVGLTAAEIATISAQKYVPMLAKGGVVDKPTYAMIGEAGKEVVMPLENNTGWISELANKISAIMEKDFIGAVEYQQPIPAYAGNTTINNNYNQTINSPRIPSRKEIYRDTKNLLALKRN